MHNEDDVNYRGFYQLQQVHKYCLQAIYGVYFKGVKKEVVRSISVFRQTYVTLKSF